MAIKQLSEFEKGQTGMSLLQRNWIAIIHHDLCQSLVDSMISCYQAVIGAYRHPTKY